MKNREVDKRKELTEAVDWGRWLKGANCLWNGSRDSAAALTSCGVAVLHPPKDQPDFQHGSRVSDDTLKPVSYIGAGAALPFSPPSQVDDDRPFQLGTTVLAGWPFAARVHPCHAWVARG